MVNPPAFRPLHDKVLVKRDDSLTKTPQGIFIPEVSKEKPKTGTVVAVSKGRTNETTGAIEPLSVKVGDKIVFSIFTGTEIKIDGEDFLVMSEDEILAVMGE